MAHDVRLVKLINGDTVLGKWDEQDKKLKDVAVIQTIPTAQGAQMMLLPFGYPFEAEITGEIDGQHVMYVFKKFPEELKTKYLEAISNLTLASGGELRNLERMAQAGRGPAGDFASQFLKK
ncbi:hypothetical protein PCS_02378 [Desulfocurvibacter africanus PCS]|uniref:Uncharacterized protein n=1 Tax=Desulfocurvibacter africanus PCS TaxID=1262666 RepID=M5Q1T9_DESAF|nr:hypothetical protein [Desulfocurvibacter africanus]EMG36843.1 hypothetical protein PCS_02378 [Desulfocurvibacter africanus PCS]